MEEARTAWRRQARAAAGREGVPRAGLEAALAPSDGVLASLAVEAGAPVPDRACLRALSNAAYRDLVAHTMAAAFLCNATAAGGEEADPELRAQARRLVAELGQRLSLLP